MIPWPIAVITILFAVPMAWSASTLWRALSAGFAPGLLSAVWVLVTGAVVLGLAGLREWARKLAVATAAAWMLGALGAAVAAVMAVPPQPRASLLSAGLALLPMVIMRYLTRPHVKQWFTQASAGSGTKRVEQRAGRSQVDMPSSEFAQER